MKIQSINLYYINYFLLSYIFVSIALNFNITFKVHFNNNLYKYLLQLGKKMKNILFSLSSFITQYIL